MSSPVTLGHFLSSPVTFKRVTQQKLEKPML